VMRLRVSPSLNAEASIWTRRLHVAAASPRGRSGAGEKRLAEIDARLGRDRR